MNDDLIQWKVYQKVAPLWARRLTQDEAVRTLEGTISAKAGDYLCRGVEGELWAQKPEKFELKYRAEGAVDPQGFGLFVPIAATNRVYARRVATSFCVATDFGTLEGKPGDYLVQKWGPFPPKGEVPERDQWVVARTVFEKSYKLLSALPHEE